MKRMGASLAFFLIITILVQSGHGAGPETVPVRDCSSNCSLGTADPSPYPAGQKTAYNIPLGVCDWTVGKTGDPAAFEVAARLGLDGVQVSLVPKGDTLALANEEFRRTFLQAVRKSRIPIASFAVGDLNNVPLKSDPRAEKWLAKGIDVAAVMNVKVILVPFFGKGELRDDPAGIDAVVAALKRLAPKAQAKGVVLALESYLSAADNIKILERVGSPAVKVYYDVGNSQDVGYPILDEIRELGDRIVEVHAKDTKDLYGQGSMDFAAVRQALEAIGYKGWFVIEGTKTPLGIEESVRYDADYLRMVFSEAGPAVPDSEKGPVATATVLSEQEFPPLKLIKESAPKYPLSALRSDIQGSIVIGGIVDTEGRVTRMRVLRSIPALDEAAVEAVRKWVYEPFVLEGRPCPFAITVTMNFAKGDTPRPRPKVKSPKPIRQAGPDYPGEAKRSNVEGVVLLGITIDARGGVTDVDVLKSAPGLDEAAVTAVREWQYAVATYGGRPIPYYITVAIKFSLKASRTAK